MGILTVQAIKRWGVRTVREEAIVLQPKQWGRGIRYIVGGTIFGSVGADGACPGPLFALLGGGVGVMTWPSEAPSSGLDLRLVAAPGSPLTAGLQFSARLSRSSRRTATHTRDRSPYERHHRPVLPFAASAGPRRVLIVGGVAGGASCAARLRRLDEAAEIVVFERGPYVPSPMRAALLRRQHHHGREHVAGGLPRAVPAALQRGGADRDRSHGHRPPARTIRVRDVPTGTSPRGAVTNVLVLSPGAAPIRPPLPGVDQPGVFAVRTIPTRGRSGVDCPAAGPDRGGRRGRLHRWRWSRTWSSAGWR